MRTARLLSAALVVAAFGPTSAQDDARRPYFTLSTNRTWAPGDKPNIHLWSRNVDSLEFRVYRVNDPVLFFRKLEDVHRMGGDAARPEPGAVTWIERIHRYKGRMRRIVADGFRAQYTPDSRAAIRSWMAERRRGPVNRAATFATLPLLNDQQVVAVWKQSISRPNSWDGGPISIDVTDKGLYLVEAAHGELRAYTVVIVTELAVITKTAPGRIVALAANSRSGEPVSGVPLFIWSGKREITRAQSDSTGFAEVSVTNQPIESALVLARHGADFAISNLYAWNLSDAADRYVNGYIYTDRPIYRPSHVVHWKGILRTETGQGYEIPKPRAIQVEITDPEGKTVGRSSATLSAMGTLSGDFSIPADAALGYYSIQLHGDPIELSGGFHVEEYKKPEYEVRVTPEQRRAVQGGSVQAVISARYFFGEPVRNAKATWVVHRARYWYPLYADEEDGYEEGQEYYGGDQVSEQTGQLDADGRLTVTVPLDVSEQKWDMRYRIEARVTDAANREISGAAQVLATHGTFMVHIEPQRYVYQPGDRAGFNIETRDYDGNPVQASVRIVLTENPRGKEPARSAPQHAETRTDAKGQGTVQFTVSSAGSYTARATANAGQGREVESGSWIWVSGGDWGSERGERIQIVTDKKTYKPGETAKLLILTGVPKARVLVTVEGRELYSRRLVDAQSPTVTVDIPVQAGQEPNFFVGAVFVKDGKLYEGFKRVKVPASEKQLKVEITPSKKEFKPGDPAVYTVSTRDFAGKPVSAELSLGVVDEAIYAIRPDTAPDMMTFFYGSAPNRVGTQSSLSYYFHGEAGKRRMQLAGLRSRRNLAQLKPEQPIQPVIRKAFPDTAYWVANVTTDAAGLAKASFDFPDALTTWRATARGITRDTKVGSALEKVIVRKNLMLRLSTPRFFTQGDEVTLSVLVHNYLKTEKTARVSLDIEGLELLDGSTRDVKIPSGAESKLDWRVRAVKPGQVKLTGKALTNEESDGMEITLPINPYGVKLAKSAAGSIATATGDRTEEIAFPAQIEPDSRSLEISVTPSVGGAIFGALDYLTTFPYGCTEQTMSSFLPNIVVSQALRELKVPGKLESADLSKKIKAGLDRLYDFQHEDGGWGWWQTDDSHPFMSAYVVSGLSQAKAAGHAVRDEAIDRGREWLRKQLKENRKLSPDLAAYLAYAIGGQFDAAWPQREKLTSYGAALLGLALHTAKDPRANEMVALVESKAKSDERDAYWPVERDTLMDFHGDTTAEATAHALKLLARAKSASPLIEKAAFWLASHRDQGSHWSSTKQTAMVIYGLIDYLKASGELKPDFSATVWVNDKQVLTRRFTAADALALEAPSIRLTAAQLAPGANRVRVTKSGAGKLYWSTRAEYYSTEDQLAQTGSVALNLAREYFKLSPVKEGDRILYQLEPLPATVQPGDVVVVRLTLKGGTWNYLLIEDPIPAGAEFIEKDDLYPLKNRPPWWQYSYARREFHDDRAALFQTYFYRETSQHLYMMKIVNPGKFRVSPARVQPMYQPQYLSTSDSKVVEVR